MTLYNPSGTVLVVTSDEEFADMIRLRVLNARENRLRIRRATNRLSLARHLQVYDPGQVILDPALEDYHDCVSYIANKSPRM